MFAFFSELNFPRSVILLSIIASGVLGWFVYEGTQRRDQIANEKRNAPNVVREIHQLGFAVEELDSMRRARGLDGVSADTEYDVRKVAKLRTVQIGDVDIDPNDRTVVNGKGLQDKIYTIRPADSDRTFKRVNIGNFLYKLETDVGRVVVTKIELTPGNGRLRPGEVGTDDWDFVIEVTTRERVDDGA